MKDLDTNGNESISFFMAGNFEFYCFQWRRLLSLVISVLAQWFKYNFPMGIDYQSIFFTEDDFGPTQLAHNVVSTSIQRYLDVMNVRWTLL